MDGNGHPYVGLMIAKVDGVPSWRCTGTLIWKFTQAGTVEFACLMPGHYEAGMKGSIRVNAK